MLQFRRDRQVSAVDALVALNSEGADLCELRSGLDEDQITELGHVTGIEVPGDLRQLLLFTNGAYLYGRACVIFGRHVGKPPHEIGDIGETTLWYRTHAALASDELVFGQRSGGGVFVLSTNPKGHATGFRVWFPGEDQEEEVFTSLAAWLTAEISFWREVTSMPGTELRS